MPRGAGWCGGRAEPHCAIAGAVVCAARRQQAGATLRDNIAGDTSSVVVVTTETTAAGNHPQLARAVQVWCSPLTPALGSSSSRGRGRLLSGGWVGGGGGQRPRRQATGECGCVCARGYSRPASHTQPMLPAGCSTAAIADRSSLLLIAAVQLTHTLRGTLPPTTIRLLSLPHPVSSCHAAGPASGVVGLGRSLHQARGRTGPAALLPG